MSAPSATSSQLLAVVERARRKGGGDLPIVVRADPTQIPNIQLQHATVTGSRSPLEIRSLVSRQGDGLVVLTDCDHHDLGDDLMGRIAGSRIWTLDRWQAVKELFSARAVSRDLARKPHLADALIEARPLSGYPPVRSGVLDTDTALSALLREYLKIPEDLDTLAGFVQWAMRKDAAHLLSGMRHEVDADLRRLLTDRYGAGAKVVMAVLRSGFGEDLIPLGIVGGAIHDRTAPDTGEARIRLKLKLEEQELPSEAWREIADAVHQIVRSSENQEHAAAWMVRSDTLLSEFNGGEFAHLSDLIPSGFEQRVQRAGAAVATWASQPESHEADERSQKAIDRAATHERAETGRIEGMRMASRLIRRGTGPIEWGNQIDSAARAYHGDGSWIDWARVVVARGETDPGLSALYAELTERFDRGRVADNERFAKFAQLIGGTIPQEAMGIEDVLASIVAPIAEHQGVLLVVLDGMGWPSFLEVYSAVSTHGWTWWQDDAGQYVRPVLAVLPTVTEFSRTSLFAGTVRQGSGESERRAFKEHQALLDVSKPGKPPVLHHKAALRKGGLDAVPEELLSDIADPQQQVVAVVLNNIDERLKDVVAPPAGWGLDELHPMRALLRKAQEADRVVVFTADHGHILDRDAAQISAPGGGERWKPAEAGVADGEIEVSGPRVVGPNGQPGGRVVLPWVEQRQYGTKRNGYHGGITPQEVLVPLAILSVNEQPDGWTPVSFSAPNWWHYRPKIDPPALPTPKRGKKPPTDAPTLFDPVVLSDGSWLDRIIEALSPYRTPAIRLTDDEIRAMLKVLDEHGGMAVGEKRLSEMSGLSYARIGRYVSQLQQLVNIEGYEVVSAAGREVRFERALLERQLELG